MGLVHLLFLQNWKNCIKPWRFKWLEGAYCPLESFSSYYIRRFFFSIEFGLVRFSIGCVFR